MKKYNYNKEKFFLVCEQRNQFYGDEPEPYTLNEIKDILIDYHSIDQPLDIKRYSLRTLLDIYEWGIYKDKEGINTINYERLR